MVYSDEYDQENVSFQEFEDLANEKDGVVVIGKKSPSMNFSFGRQSQGCSMPKEIEGAPETTINVIAETKPQLT